METASNAPPSCIPESSPTTTPTQTTSAGSLFCLTVKFYAPPVIVARLLPEISQLLQNPDVCGVSISGSSDAPEDTFAAGANLTGR